MPSTSGDNNNNDASSARIISNKAAAAESNNNNNVRESVPEAADDMQSDMQVDDAPLFGNRLFVLHYPNLLVRESMSMRHLIYQIQLKRVDIGENVIGIRVRF